MNNPNPLTYLAQVRRTRRICALLPVLTTRQFLLLISMTRLTASLRGVAMIGLVRVVEKCVPNKNTGASLKGVKPSRKAVVYISSPLRAEEGG